MQDVVLTAALVVLLVVSAAFAAQAASPALLVAQNDPVEVPHNPPPTPATEQPADSAADVAKALEGTRYNTGLPDAPTGWVTFKTPFEQVIVVMTVATLAVTLAALILMGWRSGMTPEFTRAFIVVVIVFAALFLIAAGYSDKQAAPVYALLGTIVGYIFGKLDKQDDKQDGSQKDDQSPEKPPAAGTPEGGK